MYRYLKKQDAFTLIEIMVVLFLVVSFTALGLGYNRSTDENIAFFRDQGTIVSEIYKVRSSVLASYTSGDICAQGIEILDSQTIQVFGQKGPAGPCPDYTSKPTLSDINKVVIETIALEDVSITSWNFNEVLFVPPYLSVYDYMIAGETGNPCFTIEVGGLSGGIEINAAGQVNAIQSCP